MWQELFGLKNADDEEAFKTAAELGQPLTGEEKSLPLHVEVCARRFEALVTLSKAQYNQSRSNKFLALCIIALLIVTKVVTVDSIVAAIKDFLLS